MLEHSPQPKGQRKTAFTVWIRPATVQASRIKHVFEQPLTTQIIQNHKIQVKQTLPAHNSLHEYEPKTYQMSEPRPAPFRANCPFLAGETLAPLPRARDWEALSSSRLELIRSSKVGMPQISAALQNNPEVKLWVSRVTNVEKTNSLNF